jgi:uncharacterized protein YkwD
VKVRAFVLPFAAALAAGALALPARALAGDCSPGADWPATRGDFESQILDLTNSHRQSLGLSTLAVSPTLSASAEWKAQHMARYEYMDHSDPAPPVSRTFGQRIADCGYSAGSVGENIAFGYQTPQAVFQAWLESPGHKANIENPDWRAIGVGAAVGGDGYVYWAQDFGSGNDSGAPPPAPPPPPPPRAAA